MYAAIDLGTNTFHMIIVDVHNGRSTVVYRKRYFVKLAYDSVEEIGASGWQRGLNAILSFKKSLGRFNIKKYRAYGTSIFRIAKNGKDYADFLKNKSGINISVLSGSEEAKLIFYGAKMAGITDKGRNMIIDIGGGSVEFILTRGGDMIFEQSSQVGILELYHRFDINSAQTVESLAAIEQYLYINTNALREKLKGVAIDSLIGTAGSFDVLSSYMRARKKPNRNELSLNYFKNIYKSIAYTTDEERERIHWVPQERKKLIVFAFAIIDFALKISGANLIRVTPYSMKEGMIWEMMNEDKN